MVVLVQLSPTLPLLVPILVLISYHSFLSSFFCNFTFFIPIFLELFLIFSTFFFTAPNNSIEVFNGFNPCSAILFSNFFSLFFQIQFIVIFFLLFKRKKIKMAAIGLIITSMAPIMLIFMRILALLAVILSSKMPLSTSILALLIQLKQFIINVNNNKNE